MSLFWPVMDSWLWLLFAIPFGVLGTISMKLSDGLKKWKPTLFVFLFYLISFSALTLAIQGIDTSIVYAIWSGVGTLLVVIMSVLIFDESISIKKGLSIFCVVLGVMGIYLTNAFPTL